MTEGKSSFEQLLERGGEAWVTALTIINTGQISEQRVDQLLTAYPEFATWKKEQDRAAGKH